MSKGEYVGVGNIAHKVKKEYVGVDGIARKVKKIYIGDSNNKARLAWSGFTPMFVGIGTIPVSSGNGSNYLYRVEYSENATTWNSIDNPFTYTTDGVVSPSISVSRTYNGIVYGNKKYLFANINRLAYSEDGISWTYYDVPKNNTTYNTYISNISYCNSMFFFFRFLSDTWVYEIFTSSDGINWTFRSSINYNIDIMDYVKVVYCTLGGKNVYVFINNAKIYYSENLISWTKYDDANLSFSNIFVSTYNNNLYAICADSTDGYFSMFKFNTENFNRTVNSHWNAITSLSAYNYDTDEVLISFDDETKIWNLQTNIVRTGEYFNRNPIHNNRSFVYGGGKYIALSTDSNSRCLLYYKNSNSTSWTLVDTDVSNYTYGYFAYTYGHEVNNALI